MAHYLGSFSRRQLLGALGATGLGAAGGLFGGIRSATAQPLPATLPEVDRLAVRVVTDSYYHQFESGGRVRDVTVQRYTRPPSKELPRSLINEWGLSLHLE